MTELEKRLVICLMGLLDQVDEDCPHEYRTRHLVDAMEDSRELIQEVKELMKGLPT